MKHETKPYRVSLSSTQFALEQVMRRIAALEKQNDGLAKLNKDFEIRMNEAAIKQGRINERFLERLGRIERRVSSGDPE